MRTDNFDLVSSKSETSCWDSGAELLASGLMLGLLSAHHTVSDPRSGWCLAQKCLHLLLKWCVVKCLHSCRRMFQVFDFFF